MKNLRNKSGFTLIELMIVVVIIGILAAIAIPKFTQVSNTAKQAEAEPILKQICSLAEAEFLKSDEWPANIDGIAGWDEPEAKYFGTWGFADGVASTVTTEDNLQDAEMDCTTKEVTLS